MGGNIGPCECCGADSGEPPDPPECCDGSTDPLHVTIISISSVINLDSGDRVNVSIPWRDPGEWRSRTVAGLGTWDGDVSTIVSTPADSQDARSKIMSENFRYRLFCPEFPGVYRGVYGKVESKISDPATNLWSAYCSPVRCAGRSVPKLITTGTYPFYDRHFGVVTVENPDCVIGTPSNMFCNYTPSGDGTMTFAGLDDPFGTYTLSLSYVSTGTPPVFWPLLNGISFDLTAAVSVNDIPADFLKFYTNVTGLNPTGTTYPFGNPPPDVGAGFLYGSYNLDSCVEIRAVVNLGGSGWGGLQLAFATRYDAVLGGTAPAGWYCGSVFGGNAPSGLPNFFTVYTPFATSAHGAFSTNAQRLEIPAGLYEPSPAVYYQQRLSSGLVRVTIGAPPCDRLPGAPSAGIIQSPPLGNTSYLIAVITPPS